MSGASRPDGDTLMSISMRNKGTSLVREGGGNMFTPSFQMHS